MIKNYLKIAWRNLYRSKVNSFINVIGLSAGMAVAVLIGLWMWDELSFNKTHGNYDRIAQVWQNVTNNNEVQTWQNVPFPLAAELRKSYGSDFKYVVMAADITNHILTFGDKKLTTRGGYFEPHVTDMLTLKMLKGGSNSFNDPTAILISKTTAGAYFGSDDPINKVMKIDNRINATITGVYDDIPMNSSFANTKFIAAWDLFYNNNDWVKHAEDPWRPNAFAIYTQLADGANPADVSLKIKDAKLNKVSKVLAKKKPALFLYPMSRWHLYSDFKNGVYVGGRIQYVWMFGIIGLFVLLLACINFMNLSTARSEKRAREVGIRKAIGSMRKQLVYQFLSESVLVVCIAFGIALLFVLLSLPYFNQLADKDMHIMWANPVFWLMLSVFCIVTSLIAGSYPAFYLSSFKPVNALKNSFRVGKLAAMPRKVLVTVQFVVSITLIIGTIIVYKQIQFAKDRAIGFSSDGLVCVPMLTNDVHKHMDVVKNQLLQTGAVTSVAEASAPPTEIWSSTSGIEWAGKDPAMSVDFAVTEVSYDYGNTVGWQFVKGRDFSPRFPADSSNIIVNEAAVAFMNLKNPIGETIKWFDQKYTVVGVIKDVMQSPYGRPRPAVYGLSTYAGAVVLLKLGRRSNTSQAIAAIAGVFKKNNPDQPFEFSFIDEDYNMKFGNEERISKLAWCFTGLAILISCLGLFGMASYVAEQRTKEIGVRKVLGASVAQIWVLLSTDFIKVVLISCLIASPVAYYFLHNWLQNYDYRISIGPGVFVLSAALALIITIITISFQAIKAATVNPVKSLKSE
ncbi:FtsX-like permease family protein [Mucilaginibacter calamicampi]|uniref:FtsX-like permease family protein n=1 Tax=Mucilaginibacter calamicampi TaxID=1302352 RepID=A0ABW2YWW0_9SPHI